MAKTTSDYLVERLREWGVQRIYGFPGDGINGVMGALNRASDKVRFVQTRHEEMAAFMACAHAKFTGEVGVCLATSGPGAIHLLNGLYDAKGDHQPVVAIMGQQSTLALGGDYQQEVDLISLFKDVAGAYVQSIVNPAQVRQIVDRAFRIARAERCVTAIVFPKDVQEQDAVPSPPRKHGCVYTGVGYEPPEVVPTEAQLRRAAEVLNAGEKVAMVVGAGALQATDEVIQVAERLGAGVAKALLGKAAVPDDLPYVTGGMGLLGTRPSWTMMQECDTLLMVGSSFPYSEFLPKEGQARGVQIDIKPRMLSLRYPMEVPLHGEARLTLQRLLPMLEAKKDRSWREKIESDVKDWWEVLEARAMHSANPINPQRVVWELSSRLPEDVIVASDSGSAANWYARDLKFRRGMMGSLSGKLATMCPGVPYVIAAKFAFPDRPAIALVGDGAMQMLGINGLISVAAYWREWSDPRLIVAVLHNNDLNQVTWEQRVMSGDPKFEDSQIVPDFSYARYAQELGLEGIRIEDPEAVGRAWDVALKSDRPTVLDFVTDPNVPPLPPHISAKQATELMASMIKGDPDSLSVARQSFKELVATYIGS